MGGGFGILVAVGLVILIGGLLALGRFYPGSGAEVLDWRPTRSVEIEAELELDDIDQMLAAQNERRRRRGERERTIEEFELSVSDSLREQRARQDAYLASLESSEEAERDLADLLATTNRGRERRGLPPLDLDELRAQMHAARPGPGGG